jgi:integrase
MSNEIQPSLAGAAATSSAAAEPSLGAAATTALRPSSHRPCTTVGELIDRYMAGYAGRDGARVFRLATWKAYLGDRPLLELTDDEIFHALEAIAAEPARVYKGRDASGNRVFRAKGGPRSAATVNRFHAALSAVFTWAIKKRQAPRGWKNPARDVERRRESRGVVRFLTDDERTRLLTACRASKWPRLYLLVLLAITSGARRGELLGLRWNALDFDRAEAYLAGSKNGDPRTLVLMPAVLEELRRFHAEDVRRFGLGTAQQLVFHSRVRPDLAYHFEEVWRAALKAARIRKFRYHDLRHTCASYLAQQGASLLEIGAVLGTEP